MARKKKEEKAVDEVKSTVEPVEEKKPKKVKKAYHIVATLNAKDYEADTDDLDEAIYSLRPKVLYSSLILRITKNDKTVVKIFYLKDARRLFSNSLTRFAFVRDVNLRLK